MENPTHQQKKAADVLIIGGGIIGVCAGYYLTREGYSVTLVEKDQLNAGSTYGNAGLILPSDSLPVPGPGVLTQGLRWMLDSTSPFYIKPTLDPSVLRWLWNFQGACRESAWKQAAPLLTQLSVESIRLFIQLLQNESLDCHFHREGLLLLYQTRSGFEKGKKLLDKLEGLGIKGESLSPERLESIFPPVGPEIQGGIYFQPDAHLDPAVFTARLAQRAAASGQIVVENCEVLDFQVRNREITAVQTTRGKLKADHVVLAAGAWTAKLAAKTGIRLPIQPAKGYNITVERPTNYPEIPLILEEAKIAVTPLGDTLRLAGTLELAGLDQEINQQRVNAIQRNAQDYLNLDLDQQPLVEIWRGLRPCTPDGLPIIGISSSVKNLVIASGHCMLGVSQAPMTGKLVADLVQDREPGLDLSSLSPDRF